MTEPLVPFIRALQRVESDLSVDEAADILWLALHMRRAEGLPNAPPPPPTRQLLAADSPRTPLPPAPADSAPHGIPAAAEPRTDTAPLAPAAPSPTGPASIYQPPAGPARTPGGLPLRTPAAPAIAGKRELLRALRPLVRRGASGHRRQLHLAATVQRIADEGLWLPCLRPATERWFQVTVLIERSASMGMWQKLAAEFLHMLKSAGAFSRVRGYQLTAGTEPAIYALHARPGGSQRPVPPSQLRDPRGRTLILILTDCVSAAWSDGCMSRLLAELARAGPVALLHMFPSYMMERTALAEALPIWLHASAPGVANDRLSAVLQDGFQTLLRESRHYLKLPVLTLEASALSAWARMLGASAGVWVSGCALPCRGPAPGQTSTEEPTDPEPAGSAFETAAISPAERVRDFRLSASPLARQLARLLTVFHGTGFSLPILRLLRQALVPAARPHHEAEVLLGGLLETLSEGSGQTPSDPERVRYDFIAGVPELLQAMPRVLAQEPPPDGGQVLEALTGYVAQQFGSTRDFMAVVSTLSVMGQGESAFAQLSHELLRRLGGRYAALVHDGSALLIKWSGASHPHRNRVELAAYLGDRLAASLVAVTAPEEGLPIERWLLGLQRFGTLVLADATLGIAEQLCEHASWLEEPLRTRLRGALQCGRACLSTPAESTVSAALAAVQSIEQESFGSTRELAAQRICADAAMAAAVPWLDEQPHGDRLRQLVQAILHAAQDLLPAAPWRLRPVISSHLRTQLLDERSYIPPLWRRNGRQVLVAGDLGWIGPRLRARAAALGTLLATTGYDLLFGGVLGVERAALRAYVAERERSSDGESLRMPPVVEGNQLARNVLTQLQSADGRGRSDGGLHYPDATFLLGETPYVEWLADKGFKNAQGLMTNHALIPLPWTGTTAQAVFKRFWDERQKYRALDGRRLGFIDSWWAPDATPLERTWRAIHVLDVSFFPDSLRQYRQFALNMLRLVVLATERIELLLATPRWHSYAASLAAAAYRPESALPEPSVGESRRAPQTESELLQEHLAELAAYVAQVPREELRETTLRALGSLLPAMRQWLAFDFAHIVELTDQDTTIAVALVAWLVPLVIEHAWKLSRSALLSAQFRTPARLYSLTTLLAVMRRAHPHDQEYRHEVLEVATAWAQMYLQVLMPELGETRLTLIRAWLKESAITAEGELIERLLIDSSTETRIVGYLLLQSQDAPLPEQLTEPCLNRELQLAELKGELRPLTILEGCRAKTSTLDALIAGQLRDRIERARSPRPATEELLHPQRGRPLKAASGPVRTERAVAGAAPEKPPLDRPHFRANEHRPGAVPEGYFSVCLGEADDVVFFRESTFVNLRDFLDTLYLSYLKDRFDAFSYGAQWVLSIAETDQILVSWGWLCGVDHRAYAAKSNWLEMTRLGDAGLVAGTAWHVRSGDIKSYGIAVDEHLHYLVAMSDKRKLLTLVAKELLIESAPETNDQRRYLYTAIFRMPDDMVFGVGDRRVLRQRSAAPAANSPEDGS